MAKRQYTKEQKERQKLWVEKIKLINPDHIKAIKRKAKDKIRNITREFLDKFKSERGCKYCSEKHPRALDCHHLNKTNKKLVSRLCLEGYSLKKIQSELQKCEIICSNCHRKLHAKDNNKSQAWRKILPRMMKEKSGCVRCGEKTWQCLDFHHVMNKILNVGQLVRKKGVTKEDVIAEISKCKVLCSNCHRKHHSSS